MKCPFCEVRAITCKCTWPVEKYIPTSVRELAAGDRICRTKELRPKPGSHAIVNAVEQVGVIAFRTIDGRDVVTIQGYRITITIYRRNLPSRKKTFECKPGSGYRKAAMVACGIGCCEFCAMERSEAVRLCPDHWRAGVGLELAA